MSELLFFEDTQVGLSFETGGVMVPESHIVQFAGLSGDFLDLHMDDDYARSLGFPSRVAHGLLGLILVDVLKNRPSTCVPLTDNVSPRAVHTRGVQDVPAT